MRARRINGFLWMGLTGILIIGTSFFADVYQAFRGDQTIWWTDQAKPLTLERTRDNFELYVGGKLLQKHLAEKTLFSSDKDGKQYPVVAGDIAVRLNNWDNVRSSILATTTVTGFGLGVATTLFVIGLARYFAWGARPRSPEDQADVRG